MNEDKYLQEDAYTGMFILTYCWYAWTYARTHIYIYMHLSSWLCMYHPCAIHNFCTYFLKLGFLACPGTDLSCLFGLECSFLASASFFLFFFAISSLFSCSFLSSLCWALVRMMSALVDTLLPPHWSSLLASSFLSSLFESRESVPSSHFLLLLCISNFIRRIVCSLSRSSTVCHAWKQIFPLVPPWGVLQRGTLQMSHSQKVSRLFLVLAHSWQLLLPLYMLESIQTMQCSIDWLEYKRTVFKAPFLNFWTAFLRTGHGFLDLYSVRICWISSSRMSSVSPVFETESFRVFFSNNKRDNKFIESSSKKSCNGWLYNLLLTLSIVRSFFDSESNQGLMQNKG